MNKKGFELSINFIVTLILAIVVFILGAQFFYNLAEQTDDISKATFESMDERVDDLLCDSSQKTCIGTATKTIRSGEIGVFSLSISNIMDDADPDNQFEIKITKGVGYDTQNNPIDNYLVCLPDCDVGSRTETIKKNDRATIGIGIQVPKDNSVATGLYPFTVDITVNGGTYDKQQFYVKVP